DLSTTHDSLPPSFLPPTIPNAERIVDALGQVHAYWWDHPKLGNGIGQPHTADSIREQTAADTKNVLALLEFLGDRISSEQRDIFDAALEKIQELRTQWLLGRKDFTLIHDDLHAGNFLYPRNPQKDTLRIIDWKSWSIKPGAADMANMMALYWTRERRLQLQDTLLRRYHARLLENGVTGYDWETCWNDYRMSIIDLLFFPVWQWSVGVPDFIWWHNLDRLLIAQRDLSSI
ncbi:MAG: phosphotransferase, partial [Chitinophagaceae bacterium]|nr:phosphotransferase [Anaerolineae bacterium]